MSLNATIANPTVANVGLGQVLLARAPDQLMTILGSCIGVAVYQPRLKIGALAHVVLPCSTGRDVSPAVAGKFADTAVPHILELLGKQGVSPAGLIAKIAGGASMFNSQGPLQIGDSNQTAVIAALELAKIRVAASHCGGVKGRRVTFSPETGALLVEIAGQSVIEL